MQIDYELEAEPDAIKCRICQHPLDEGDHSECTKIAKSEIKPSLHTMVNQWLDINQEGDDREL